MKSLLFATNNKTKFTMAKSVCDSHGIKLIQNGLDVEEIQSEDADRIALDKARKVFKVLKRPVVISDDSWSFEGLNGFPGAYMHSINRWFTPEDFLRLTLPLKNRRVILSQIVVYQDKSQQKLFKAQTAGTILKEIRGKSDHPNHTVITLQGDNGSSIAEVHDNTKDYNDFAGSRVWHEFAEWFNTSFS